MPSCVARAHRTGSGSDRVGRRAVAPGTRSGEMVSPGVGAGGYRPGEMISIRVGAGGYRHPAYPVATAPGSVAACHLPERVTVQALERRDLASEIEPLDGPPAARLAERPPQFRAPSQQLQLPHDRGDRPPRDDAPRDAVDDVLGQP